MSENVKEVKKIAYAEKESTIVVTAITEDGYATLHGDHSHFEKGLVPYNAKFIDSLVYKNKDFKRWRYTIWSSSRVHNKNRWKILLLS
mgnify:CR=1 FL=1